MTKQYLFINGEVITVNQDNEVVEAVAVRRNRIIAVGSNEEILVFKDADSKVIDLEGRTLMPGFIDSHLHISMHGTNSISISCKDKEVQSISNLLEKLKERVEQTPVNEWVRAWGYNETTITDKRFPTKEELDVISTEHPIMITRACGHISVVNSKALDIAGVDENTPDPEGGEIQRNSEGKPTGVLLENAHMEMFSIAAFSKEELSQSHKMVHTQKGQKSHQLD